MELSDAGFEMIKDEEALIDGLYDDPSKYCTYGVGHLVHKKPSFLLAAAQADGAWKSYVKRKWKHLPYLDRSVRLASGFGGLTEAATALAREAVGAAKGDKLVADEATVLATTPEDLLRSRVKEFERAVRNSVKIPLTQNEFDALVSLAYNIGPAGFSNSTAVKRINEGIYRTGDAGARRKAISEIETAILAWNKSGGKVLPGLQRRRQREADAFLAEARKDLIKADQKGPAAPAAPSRSPTPAISPLSKWLIAPDSPQSSFFPTFPGSREDWMCKVNH